MTNREKIRMTKSQKPTEDSMTIVIRYPELWSGVKGGLSFIL